MVHFGEDLPSFQAAFILIHIFPSFNYKFSFLPSFIDSFPSFFFFRFIPWPSFSESYFIIMQPCSLSSTLLSFLVFPFFLPSHLF